MPLLRERSQPDSTMVIVLRGHEILQNIPKHGTRVRITGLHYLVLFRKTSHNSSNVLMVKACHPVKGHDVLFDKIFFFLRCSEITAC